MKRAGFTLLELIAAIALTGIVALLVYGTAHAGLDTRERVERHRSAAAAHVIVRELLVDALRHPQEGGGTAMNDTLFLLHDAVREDGTPGDAVRFSSRGIASPLGAPLTWNITLEPTTAGLRLHAAPTSGDAAPLETLVPGVIGLSVYVLDRTADTQWLDRWDVAGRIPAAVALHFLVAPGALAPPPLVVHTALERVH